MSSIALTSEQVRAATSRHKRLFIEANPGSGKTTVAAERYGVVRFDSIHRDQRATMALSFTRSATAELRERIHRRWGSVALAWPHGTATIDSLIYNVVQHFLRKGILRWPGNHTTLEVLDHWRGHRGYRWLTPGSVRRKLTVDNKGNVTSRAVAVTDSRSGFGDKTSFHKHLTRGVCTHDEIRDVLASALRDTGRQRAVIEYLSLSVSHLIVDEVFDANRLDLGLVLLASQANIDVTLVGDPWQALYGFRGSMPELVPSVLKSRDFKTLPLTQSFRFQSDEMKTLSRALRNREGAAVNIGGEFDVVLASRWETLWNAPLRVLPLSFGRAANKTDAMVTLLLDHLVQSAFGIRAVFVPEALAILELGPDAYRAQGPSVLGSIAESLKTDSSSTAAKNSLNALREAVKAMGGARRPPAGNPAAEARQTARLTALSQRLGATELVPGLTVHQAKGREWNNVGLLLQPDELSTIRAGLDPSIESHRMLYVALTRARVGVTRVV